MKKLLGLALCLLLFTGCGETAVSPQQNSAAAVNPVLASSPEEILEKDGIRLSVPAGAEEVIWSRISLSDGVIAQVRFALNGDDYTLRAKVTAGPEDISGMYYEWGEPEGGQIPEGAPRCMVNETGQGVLLWYAHGCSCSLAMTEDAAGAKLTAVYADVSISK